MAEKEFRHIIRVANTDLDGSKPIFIALRKIKGVSFMFSLMVLNIAGIDKIKRAGNLTDAELKVLNDAITTPKKLGAPVWMLNRRKDPETGESGHLVGTDVRFTLDNDLKIMKKTKSYKGMRHQSGLTVRGQRTKANFRRNKGKGSLGVKRKKVGSK